MEQSRRVGRPKKVQAEEIEQTWYDLFAERSFEDRELCLKIVSAIHRALNKQDSRDTLQDFKIGIGETA